MSSRIHKSQIVPITVAFWSFWVAAVFAKGAAPTISTSAETPGWSTEATLLPQFWDSNAKAVALPSPNGKLILRVEGKKAGHTYPEEGLVPNYFLEKDGHHLHPAIHPYAIPYAMWSPNSDLLAITSSDGGAVGNWKVCTYSVEAGAVVKYKVIDQVQADLARSFPGGVNPKGNSLYSQKERDRLARDPSWVNVFALHWFKNPERLLVLASVPPSSRYGANMGKLRGYIISPTTGDILRTYTEKEFRQRWEKYLSASD